MKTEHRVAIFCFAWGLVDIGLSWQFPHMGHLPLNALALLIAFPIYLVLDR
jgi:EamA domain-containing membrane protein RarD